MASLIELLLRFKATGGPEVKKELEGISTEAKKTAGSVDDLSKKTHGGGNSLTGALSALSSIAGGPISKLLEITAAASAAGLALGAFAAVTGFQTAAKLDGLTRGLAGVSENLDDLLSQLASAKEIAKLPGLGFAEAVQGKLRLEGVGIAADLADRSLKAFGNSLALEGKGKADLDGITLALSQIAGKGKITAEDLNQIFERTGRARLALIQAFGTGDSEEIQKLNLTTTQFLDGLVSKLEELPQVGQSIGNTLENLGDRLQNVFVPLGKGLIEGLITAEPFINKVFDRIEDGARTVGQVIAAVARSGVLEDVLVKLSNTFDRLTGNDFTTFIAQGIANVLSAVANIPDTFLAVQKYISDVFTKIGEDAKLVGSYISGVYNAVSQNVTSAFQVVENRIDQTLVKIGNNLKTFVGTYVVPALNLIGLNPVIGNQDFFKKGLESATDFSLSTQLVPQLKKGEGVFAEIPTMGSLFDKIKNNGFPTAPDLNILRNGPDFMQRILGNIKPLSAVPDGLQWGSIPEVPAKQDAIQGTLERIARNTGDTADALSLRRQSLGGGQLAKLGVTAAELRGGRGSAPATVTRGNIGRRDSSLTSMARSLGYIVDRRVQDEFARTSGGGFNPR